MVDGRSIVNIFPIYYIDFTYTPPNPGRTFTMPARTTYVVKTLEITGRIIYPENKNLTFFTIL